jgi:hypothetical protein
MRLGVNGWPCVYIDGGRFDSGTSKLRFGILGGTASAAGTLGTDAAVVATRISRSDSTGPASAVRPRNQMQGLPMSFMLFRWGEPIDQPWCS